MQSWRYERNRAFGHGAELMETAVYIAIDLICRERVTQYEGLKMSDLADKWRNIRQNFRNRDKMPIDSWAGDLFAKVANEYGIENYLESAEKQFNF